MAQQLNINIETDSSRLNQYSEAFHKQQTIQPITKERYVLPEDSLDDKNQDLG